MVKKLSVFILSVVLWGGMNTAQAEKIWGVYTPPEGAIGPSGPIYLAPGGTQAFSATGLVDIDCWYDGGASPPSGYPADTIPSGKVSWVASGGTVTPSTGFSVTYTAGASTGTGGISLYVDDLSAHPAAADDAEVRADIETIYKVLPNQEELSWSDHSWPDPHKAGDIFEPHKIKYVLSGVDKGVNFAGITITEYEGFQYVSDTVPDLTQAEIEARFPGYDGNWNILAGSLRDDSDVHGYDRAALGGNWLNTGTVVISQRMKVTSPCAGSWFTTHGLSFSFKDEGEYKCCYTKKQSDNLDGTKTWKTCPDY